MSQPLIPANADVRLALKNCFEKDRYVIDETTITFLKRNGLDRYATAAAVLRHLREGRALYCKLADDGCRILERHFHGEVALMDDDSNLAYMHFIVSIQGAEIRVRAHVNCFPNSLPWN